MIYNTVGSSCCERGTSFEIPPGLKLWLPAKDVATFFQFYAVGAEMDLQSLPQWPQRQDSVSAQLADLRLIANRLGFYDAADAIKQWCKHLPELKYGCHCDLEEGQSPDGCVIDEGRIRDCHYAKKDMRKEQCEHWRPI